MGEMVISIASFIIFTAKIRMNQITSGKSSNSSIHCLDNSKLTEVQPKCTQFSLEVTERPTLNVQHIPR